ncbi:MAG: hypothetical protein RMM58_07380 [Chloroflexota bacterium]|nr:hypothetical protein [Dehalococcoidia bacterium]MDW8253681.1 hypothetical protein [Chloroflexota bacterium]
MAATLPGTRSPRQALWHLLGGKRRAALANAQASAAFEGMSGMPLREWRAAAAASLVIRGRTAAPEEGN